MRGEKISRFASRGQYTDTGRKVMRAAVDSWLLLNDDRFNEANVDVTITERDFVPRSVTVDLDGSGRIATLIVWLNGVAEIQAGDVADGSIFVDETSRWSSDGDICSLIEKAATIVIDGFAN